MAFFPCVSTAREVRCPDLSFFKKPATELAFCVLDQHEPSHPPPALRPQASWTTGSDDSGFHRPGARQSGEVPVLAHVELCSGTGSHEGLQPLRRRARLPGGWRDVVVGDDLMARLLEKAAVSLRFAVHLALLTGQRPADVLRMSTAHIAGGMLHVRQGKTAAKLRIEVTGALQELLAKIQAYKVQVKADTAQLLVNEAGQPLTKDMLRDRFDAARDAAGIPKAQFQFRDLRATAATTVDDDGGIRHAQALLGHTTEGMTAQYIRHKVGKKVKPVR